MTSAPVTHPLAGQERLRPARLAPVDRVSIAFGAMTARPLRAALSALGIALGVAALIAVVGLSSSSKARINQQLDALGTNLLTVTAGQSVFGAAASLPEEATAMVARIGPVEEVSATGDVPLSVYRTEHIDPLETNGIAVLATDVDLLATLRGEMAAGSWLTEASADFPAVVLGSKAATRLGISRADGSVTVRIGTSYYVVTGIMADNPLVDSMDSAALVGWDSAKTHLGFDGTPARIYERSTDDMVDAVAAVLPATVNPENPDQVQVSRPSDVLAAKAATDQALTSLLLALGAVSLLVGGIGVANTMVIAVLERRSEIGLRRALGATRRQILGQFLSESITLSLAGGLAGAALGVMVVTGYASSRDWPVSIPPWAIAAGLASTVLVGSLAGLFPASRAARIDPAAALSGA